MKLIHEGKKDICLNVVESGDDYLSTIKEKGYNSFEGGDILPYISKDMTGEILVFMGDEKKKNIEAFYKAYNFLKKMNIKEISIMHDHLEELFEGLLQAEYVFDKYLSEKSDFELTISADETTSELFYSTKNLVEGINITRDLVNIPPIDMYPESFANYVVDLFKDLPVEVDVLDKNQIENLNMKAFLSVSEGSDKEPKFVIIKYMPEDKKEHITFVGKGLTYDSGGYAIKTTSGMVNMKSDMAGASSVVGAIYALAKNEVQTNVVGVMALCENLISGSAYKNGDIISSMKGTTIEIANTDAEGRVTLADSLYYAATKLNSTTIVDLATLTGACIVALGEKVTGVVSNDDNVCESLIDASLRADENMFRFQVFNEHRQQIKGTEGDIKNSTTGGAGAITAGVFLEEFVENKPWAHLDIAGPAFQDSQSSYLPKGATGTPVKTLYEFAKSESEK